MQMFLVAHLVKEFSSYTSFTEIAKIAQKFNKILD